MWQRRDGRQNGETVAGRGIVRRLFVPSLSALIAAVARPVGSVQTVFAAAIHDDPEWKEF
jgi:hypothetical protein